MDIRVPMGILFTLYGCLLSLFGFVSDRAIYQRSLGINVNLLWGIVLTVFGMLMFILGRRRNRREAETREPLQQAEYVHHSGREGE